MTVAAEIPTVPTLSRSVRSLPGVGQERAAMLARLEIQSVEDLLLHRPRRYEDRQHLARIADLTPGESSICYGTVIALGVKWFARHTKSVFELIVEDGGARLHCRWWNQPYLEKYYKVGDELLLYGKLVNIKPRNMDHPETEVLEGGEENFVHLNRITPIYPLTEGLQQRWLRSLIWRTLQGFEQHIRDPYPRTAASQEGSPLTSNGAPSLNAVLPSRTRALRMLHFPESEEQVELARRRLALDEFVELQTGIQLRRRSFEQKAKRLPCTGDNQLIKRFLSKLGFRLTASQTAVLRELREDMSGAYPMRRLLQGDVGCGKTVVAACCALMCLESGYNVALMAPTEILAEQHFLNFSNWLAELGVSVQILTGSCRRATGPEQKAEPPHYRLGTLTIGTHALLEPSFAPDGLGLVIIDEQHKFGVAQRDRLLKKGHYPHLLVMTATPIPRTLGLTLYGDLDISTITDLPPGRGRIRTFVRTPDKLPKVWEFIRTQVGQGRQAYIVYPRVEDTGQPNQVKAVKKEFRNIEQQVAPFRAGLIYGSMIGTEKDEVMAAFRANRFQVLVATSLIEVGVDVPNATVMLIEHAEQFGIAQLHQMRGRIGRGGHDSYCILIAEAQDPRARDRLAILERSATGFDIAEEDLKLRGPGELLGQEQSGSPKLRFGDLASDLSLIREARAIASALVRGNAAKEYSGK